MASVKHPVFISLCCCLIIALSTAHLCMLSPTQRGSLHGINKPGAPDCKLTTKQCGGRLAGPAIILRPGQNFTVSFQKNLNHYVQATPGHFSVMWGKEGMELKQLTVLPDRNEASLTIYSVNVTIPLDRTGHFIIQTKYVTRNPDVPVEFLQCGDVTLI